MHILLVLRALRHADAHYADGDSGLVGRTTPATFA